MPMPLPSLFFLLALISSASASASTSAFLESSANGVRREGLDKALRKYAMLALSAKGAKTGVPYDVKLPPSLSGVFSQAMRLRSGSVRRRGISFNELHVPPGLLFLDDASPNSSAVNSPFVFFVYRKITSFTLYSPPSGFTFAAPLVGIIVFSGNSSISFDDDGDNIVDDDSSPGFSELSVSSPLSPISVTISVPASTNESSTIASCCFFDINGSATISSALPSSIAAASIDCNASALYDVALVVPVPPTAAPGPERGVANAVASRSRSSTNVAKLVAVAVAGGVGAVALLLAIVFVGWRLSGENKDEPDVPVAEMEEESATLQTSLIGHTRAPTAPGMRTRPSLETGSLYPAKDVFS